MSAQCPHADSLIEQRVCDHLLVGQGTEYGHRFTGVGVDFDLVCPQCAAVAREALARVCAACFDTLSVTVPWATGEHGVVGQPVVAERQTTLSFAHEMIRLEPAPEAGLIEVQPLRGAASSRWLGLTEAGQLALLDLEARQFRIITDLMGVGLDTARRLTLRTSRDGQLVAVVETTGQSGVVLEASTGDLLTMIDRGQHDVPGAEFPVAFAEIDGRSLLVAGSEWNRLDLYDARSGQILSDRPRAEWETRQLAYASSSLLVSPDGQWVLDNGFTSDGIGMVATFDIRAWLDNPFEPEDGPSKRYLCQRGDYWAGPACWTGPRTACVWGYGPGRGCLLAAAMLFDVESGEAQSWFPGPEGHFVFDDFLFAFGDRGTSVWDIQSGQRLLHDAGFQPLRYHPEARQFLTCSPGGELFVLSHLTGQS